MRGKSDLSWTNITRESLPGECGQKAWDAFVAAKEALEMEMQIEAVAQGAAQEGDTFKFSYARIGQGSIGMAIDKPAKSTASGFGGLKRPVDQREVEAVKLAQWRAEQAASGRRY